MTFRLPVCIADMLKAMVMAIHIEINIVGLRFCSGNIKLRVNKMVLLLRLINNAEKTTITEFLKPLYSSKYIRTKRSSHNVINLKDWEKLLSKFFCIAVMANTSDGMVTNNNLPFCSRFLQC